MAFPNRLFLLLLLVPAIVFSGASGGRNWMYTECAEESKVQYTFVIDTQEFGEVREFSVAPQTGWLFAECRIISCEEHKYTCSYSICPRPNTTQFVLNANGTLLNFTIPEEDAMRGGEFSLKLYKDRVEVTKLAGNQFWLYAIALALLIALIAYIAGLLRK